MEERLMFVLQYWLFLGSITLVLFIGLRIKVFGADSEKELWTKYPLNAVLSAIGAILLWPYRMGMNLKCIHYLLTKKRKDAIWQ